MLQLGTRPRRSAGTNRIRNFQKVQSSTVLEPGKEGGGANDDEMSASFPKAANRRISIAHAGTIDDQGTEGTSIRGRLAMRRAASWWHSAGGRAAAAAVMAAVAVSP